MAANSFVFYFFKAFASIFLVGGGGGGGGHDYKQKHKKEWKLLKIRMRLETNHSQHEQPTYHPVNKGSVRVSYRSAESGDMFLLFAEQIQL